MDPLVLNFIENLKKQRAKAGLNQGDIAKALSVDRSTYAYYENLKKPHLPDITTIYKIAKVLNISVYDLIPINLDDGLKVGAPDSASEKKSMSVSGEEEKLIALYRNCSEENKKKLFLQAANMSIDDAFDNKK